MSFSPLMRTAAWSVMACVVTGYVAYAKASDLLPLPNPKRWAAVDLPEPKPTRAVRAPVVATPEPMSPPQEIAVADEAAQAPAPAQQQKTPLAAAPEPAKPPPEESAAANEAVQAPTPSQPPETKAAETQAAPLPPAPKATAAPVSTPELKLTEVAKTPGPAVAVPMPKPRKAIVLPAPKPLPGKRTVSVPSTALPEKPAVAPVAVAVAAAPGAAPTADATDETGVTQIAKSDPTAVKVGPGPAEREAVPDKPAAAVPLAKVTGPIVALPKPNPRDMVALPSPKPTRLARASDPTAAAQPGAAVASPQRKPVVTRPAAKHTAALKRLLSYKLSNSDKANLKGVLSSVYRGRHTVAKAAMKRIKDPAARKVAEWYYLRSGGVGATANKIEAFRLANPHWPGQRLMRRRAEGRIFLRDPSHETVFAFFKTSKPTTGAGKAALASAHRKAGNEAQAKTLITSAWRDYVLDKSTEKLILKRHGKLLTKEDHKARIDKLLYQDRKSRVAPALRLAARLGKAEQKKVEARAAVVRRSRSAGKLLKAVKADAASDVGLYFNRIQWLRRNDRDKEAWKLLQEAPTEPDLLVDLNEWWVERRVNARSALNAGHVETAYNIAKNHGPVSGKYYADAKFLAGWIGLRFLNKPEEAYTHFLALRTAASKPKTIARAAYWLGRAAQAMGKHEESATHFQNASKYIATYYGQLAMQSLNPQPQQLMVPATPTPTEEDVERLLGRDAVLALGVVRAAGLNRLTRPFFYQLARTLESPAEVALLAELARRFDQLQASVRLSKIAFNRGLAVRDYAFPIDVLPNYKRLNDGVEAALLHALSRQESEFNAVAKSPVGARGLMQLMPRTARSVARSYRVRYRSSSLTANPSYNMMLGAAHLRDLVDIFRGSYIMALAAYNAGGPRVRQWVKAFGDPRSPNIDPIDWVEQIPFTETRNYVQKVLESVQVFRARLEGPERALQVLQDLNRGRSKAAPITVAVEPEPQPAAVNPPMSLGPAEPKK
ncbi:MAG: transglycosylase SLT domain-containing protein [Methyloligellaceae bacterium]